MSYIGATPTDVPLTSSDIADGIISTAKLATDSVTTIKVTDDNVTLAKVADGTQGDILYYGASGAPTLLGFGTSGDFLKTQGTGANPAWATAAGGAWTLISTETLGADVTPWDIDDIFTSTYDMYKMFITDFSCTGSGASSYVDMQLLVGGTAQTNDYRTLYNQVYSQIEGANTVYDGSGGDWTTAIRFENSARNNDVGTATDYLGQFEFTFYRPQDSVVNNQGSFMSTVCTGSATYNNYIYDGSWMYTSAVAATGVRFIANNGDMSAGSIVRTYGISS